MRIARRFGLLVSVLVLFATTFAGVILYQTSGQQLAIDRLRDLVTVAGRAGALGQELQKERAAAESVALEQVVVLGTLAVGVQVTPAIQEDVNATRTSYTEAITSFGSLAQPEWQSWLGHELVGPDIVAAQRLEDQVGRVQLGQRVQVNAAEWN